VETTFSVMLLQVLKVYHWTMEWNPLRNPHCLFVGKDWLYLQFKPTIWALNYLRKHMHDLPSRTWFSDIRWRHTEKNQFYWN